VTLNEALLFNSGSSQLKSSADSTLGSIAEVLKAHPSDHARIEGNTDSIGNEAMNENLSQMRAEAVKNALVSQGVSEDQLSTIGFGDSRPVASNQTSEGRAKNRRVELRIVQG
jgi:outer membrane protein OmpA-like peptidoglycan-associated protein